MKTAAGEANGPTGEQYAFGEFRVDVRTRELRRREIVVPLTPKTFDLLRVLVEATDRVVEKAELMKLLWPDSFVTEDSLTQHIAALRKALGDTADRPEYILTVPRHGYRFIAPVRTASSDARAAATPDDSAAASPNDDRPVSEPPTLLALAWVAVLTVAVLVALTWGIRLRSSPLSTPEVTRFVVPAAEGTTFSPSASLVSVSPNGRLLAFLAVRPGEEARIWVRALDSLRAREISGTDGAFGPFWSPDNQSLGFFAHHQLKTVNLLGEPPKTLCDIEAGSTPSGTWSHEGFILFSNGSALARISSTGGTPVPVTAVDTERGELAHLLPQILPDGRHFFYVARGAGGPANSWIALASVDTSERRLLIRASSQAVYAEPGYVLYAENGVLFAQPFDTKALQFTGPPRLVSDADQVGFNPSTPRAMFAASRTGILAYRTSTTRELGWFDRNGRSLGWIAATHRDSNPALSADGRRVAVSRYDAGTATRNIWILDLERGGAPSPLTAHLPWTNCPVWSADDTRIVFASSGTARRRSLYEKQVTGAADPRVLMQVDACPFDWSHNRRYLLYGVSRDNTGSSESGLWLLPSDGNAAPKALRGPWPGRVWARISPNDKWLAYVSDATGRNEVYVRSFPDGDIGPWRISSGGGIDPQWRSDGRELFFIGADQRLMAVGVMSEGSFRAETPVALFQTGLDPNGIGISGRNQYVVAPDGTRFLLNQSRPDSAPQPITVVLNWTAAIK